jgi:hypothetical protein
LEVSDGIEKGSSLAAAKADAWDMPVLRQLPQVARGNAQGLRRWTGPQGQGRGDDRRNHSHRTNGSLTANRGSHDQNPPTATGFGNSPTTQQAARDGSKRLKKV